MKSKPVIDKQDGGVIPKFFIRCLVEMEDFIVEVFTKYFFLAENVFRDCR